MNRQCTSCTEVIPCPMGNMVRRDKDLGIYIGCPVEQSMKATCLCNKAVLALPEPTNLRKEE